MKNSFKRIPILLFTFFILTACNKEKAAVNKLEGTWNLVNLSASENSLVCEAMSEEFITWTFTAYTVGDQETGALREAITIDLDTNTELYDYSVNEDGNGFTLSDGSSIVFDYRILNLTRDGLEVETTILSGVVTDCGDFTTNPPVGPTFENRMVTFTSIWARD